jgi:membrane carboxypeptidase/penicillin-binding protein
VVAVAAFARGYSPASLVWDIPAGRPGSLDGAQNLVVEGSAVQNLRGPLSLRQALANDTLTPIVQLVEQLGAQNVWRMGAALGLSSLARPGSPNPHV